MDVSQSLLVAMMFVTVLSIGIGNILMGLSGVIQRGSGISVHWLPLAWVLVLLLIHFELFWQTLVILEVKEWKFGEFLFVIVGPVLLLFATSFMLPDSARAADGDYRAHYFSIARRFFTLLAALMAWLVCVDLLFAGGMTIYSWFNLIEVALLLVLAFAKQERLHQAVTILAVGIFVLSFSLQGLGVG